jgi:uncharacterized membrane protein YfcA
MYVYLPLAEMSVNWPLVVGMGGLIGFLFGVGGGFLMTPLLIFIGVPPVVSVATSANQIVAASVSGVLAHWRRGNVDFAMGTILLIGGLIGSGVGVWLFQLLQRLGHIDLVIKLNYVVLLGAIGALMLQESIRAILRSNRPSVRRKLHKHNWLHGLPFKMRFRRSKLYISTLLPVGLGFLVGILTALMGVGGGFVIVPAMIYVLGMPTKVVVGTSLFQIIFVTANVTFLQAVTTQSVDIVLAILLLAGAVVGAQYGSRCGALLKGEKLRGLLAVIVLGVCARMGVDLVATPEGLFTLETLALR